MYFSTQTQQMYEKQFIHPTLMVKFNDNYVYYYNNTISSFVDLYI